MVVCGSDGGVGQFLNGMLIVFLSWSFYKPARATTHLSSIFNLVAKPENPSYYLSKGWTEKVVVFRRSSG